MKLSIKHNTGAVIRRLGAVPFLMKRRLASNVLANAGRAIIEDSEKMTPVAYEDLIKSHKVSRPYGRSNWVAIQLSVGNDDAWYAHIVHEDTTLRHDQGEAKFLEKAVMGRVSRIRREIKLEVVHVWRTLAARTL